MVMTTAVLNDGEEKKVERPGWICPRCGKIFSPDILECLECNKDAEKNKQLLTEEEK